MYLRSARLKNLRSFGTAVLEFSAGTEPGWHVLLGDNGSGKSTLVRALALAFVGPTEALALRQDWASWIRHGEGEASVELSVAWDLAWDTRKGGGNPPNNKVHNAKLTLVRMGPSARPAIDGSAASQRHLWSGQRGWFACSFGPFRRFTGGDKAYERLFLQNPWLARHLTAFGEDVALTEATEWLQKLRVEQLRRDSGHASTTTDPVLGHMTALINNTHLLPHGVHLSSVEVDGVVFQDPSGLKLPVDALSDGFRSVLSMTFELIRQLVVAYGPDIFTPTTNGWVEVNVPGVVLVDEVDAHLHPTWQATIGAWFMSVFPKLQFIVTTHSPLVARSAERGTLWRIRVPTPSEPGERIQKIEGIDRDRLLYGTILDALGTSGFDLPDLARSELGLQKMERMAQLARKRARASLSAAESEELQGLERIFPPVVPT